MHMPLATSEAKARRPLEVVRERGPVFRGALTVVEPDATRRRPFVVD